MSAPGLVKRLWNRLWHRQGLGRIVIKFYPDGHEASITVAPALATLSRRYWHWLYLQHLAASLAAIGESQERVRLLVAARAVAEDFVSRSSWPHVIGEAISDAGAGASEIVPERGGGVALTTQVVQRGDGMPTVRLDWFPPQARERVASSNLVLLVHIMRAATHPLEQYEIFKKIALFAEQCERAGYPRERAALQGSALHAVLHADVTEMASPSGALRRKVAVLSAEPDGEARARRDAPADPGVSRGLSALRSLRDRLASPDPLWKRPHFTIGAAAVLWAGLALAVFFLPRFGAPVPSRPTASMPPATRSHDAGLVPGRKEIRPRAEVPVAAATAPRRASRVKAKPEASAIAHRPRPSWEGELNETPRFRVVSSTLALDVAEHRSKVLAEQGVDAFVKERAGKLGRLQYGAYRFRETAEEDARHLRAQGYTAVVIPW